jgi:hypothetical protein
MGQHGGGHAPHSAGHAQAVYFRVFGYEGGDTDADGFRIPIKHGGFLDPEVRFWREQFWWPEIEPAAPARD